MFCNRYYGTFTERDNILPGVSTSLEFVVGRNMEQEIFLLGSGFSHYYDQENSILYSGLEKSAFDFFKRNKVKYFQNSMLEEKNLEKNFEKKLDRFLEADTIFCIRIWPNVITKNDFFKNMQNVPLYVELHARQGTSFLAYAGYRVMEHNEIYQCHIDGKELMRAWRIMNYEYILIEKKEMIHLKKLHLGQLELIRYTKERLEVYLNEAFMLNSEGYCAVLEYILDMSNELHRSMSLYEDLKITYFQLKQYGFFKSREILCQIWNKIDDIPIILRNNAKVSCRLWKTKWENALELAERRKNDKVFEVFEEMERMCLYEVKIFNEFLEWAEEV